MRILHLVDPGWPGGGGCPLRTLAEVIARLNGVEHDVLVLGTAAHDEVARRCGVEPIGSASASGRGRAVAAVVRAYEKARGAYDIVHSWSQRAGAVAFAAVPRRRHMVRATRLPEQRRIASVLQVARASMIVPFEPVRRAWIDAGFDARSIAVVAPAANEEAVDRDATLALYDGQQSTPFIVGMMHSPVEELDAGAAMTIAARLALAGMNVRVVVHPNAHRRAEAEMGSHRLGFAHELLLVEDDLAEPWRVACALDAAVRFGGRPAGGDVTPVLWAMAAGVPVVAEDSAEMREVIEDGASGWLVPPGDVNAVCARLVRLGEDKAAAAHVGERAAERVRERFAIDAYCERLMNEYEAILRQ